MRMRIIEPSSVCFYYYNIKHICMWVFIYYYYEDALKNAFIDIATLKYCYE